MVIVYFNSTERLFFSGHGCVYQIVATLLFISEVVAKFYIKWDCSSLLKIIGSFHVVIHLQTVCFKPENEKRRGADETLRRSKMTSDQRTTLVPDWDMISAALSLAICFWHRRGY